MTHPDARHKLLVLLTADGVDERVCRQLTDSKGAVEVRVAVPLMNSRMDGYFASDADEARLAAGRLFDVAIAVLTEHEVPATGVIGDISTSALQLLADEIAAYGPDEVVIVTHPGDEPEWEAQVLAEDAAHHPAVPTSLMHSHPIA